MAGTSNTAGQDDSASGTTSSGASSGGPGQGTDRLPELRRQLARQPWAQGLGLLEVLVLLAAAGAGLRVLVVPGAVTAAVGWIAMTTALIAVICLRPPRAVSTTVPGGAWQPGQPLPDGLQAVTAQAASRYLAAISSRRWRGAWLEIAACTDPVRHGECLSAATIPAGGMIRVRLGEHLAGRPQVAGFVLAHESYHRTGWTRHLWVFADKARITGWLIAGWAVPWPRLLAAVASIQAAHGVLRWAIEISCDLYGARAEGRSPALEGFDCFVTLNRESAPGPAWKASIERAIVIAAGLDPHPPIRLRRAIIRAWVPDRTPTVAGTSEAGSGRFRAKAVRRD